MPSNFTPYSVATLATSSKVFHCEDFSHADNTVPKVTASGLGVMRLKSSSSMASFSSSDEGDDERQRNNNGALLISSRMISIGRKFGLVLCNNEDDDDDDEEESDEKVGGIDVAVDDDDDDDEKECSIISPSNCTAILHRPVRAMVDMTALYPTTPMPRPPTPSESILLPRFNTSNANPTMSSSLILVEPRRSISDPLSFATQWFAQALMTVEYMT